MLPSVLFQGPLFVRKAFDMPTYTADPDRPDKALNPLEPSPHMTAEASRRDCAQTRLELGHLSHGGEKQLRFRM